jgi:hypothetical protein
MVQDKEVTFRNLSLVSNDDFVTATEAWNIQQISEEFSPDWIAKANRHSRKNIKNDQDVVTGLRSGRVSKPNNPNILNMTTRSVMPSLY